MNNFMIPTDRELNKARKWWEALPDFIKGKYSIWVILAMYAEEVLKRPNKGPAESDTASPHVLDREQ